jgi:uncharacterized membrane protein
MNIHPIFVHFPIALLTIYSAFEILRFHWLTSQSWYQPVKIAFLFAGTLGATAALITGEMAEGLIGGVYHIVEVHQLFAKITALIFGILCVHYLALVATPRYGEKHPWLVSIQKAFPAPILIILAVLGLASITITGAIGGAMVFGPDNDPLTSLIIRMLGLAQQ